ncbi:MAG: PAP2 superfamily protein [Candidatus Aerophobetes bacterium ADurb.Bin490]|nr:MAG: PAP2 superfamily protein [Candidatus Aerophobetes bacterium ADurb.Bin490]
MENKAARNLIIFAALIVITVPFWIFDIDIKIQSLLYDPVLKNWKFGDNPFVLFLYKYGTLVPLALGIIAAAAAGASFFVSGFERNRKPALLFLFVFLVGPGLIVNVILKGYTGSPRPREIVEFGGKWQYTKPLVLGTPGKGHSFPCGHASAGFMIAVMYFYLRHRDKSTANKVLIAGVSYGALMGFGRMAQGAHFLSDVIWAGGVVILTASLADDYLFKTGEFNYIQRKKIKLKPIGIAVAALAVTGAAAAFMLSTPFYREKANDSPVSALNTVSVYTQESSVYLMPGADKITLISRANGFGLKGNDISDNYTYLEKEGSAKINYKAEKKGFFTELIADTEITLPDSAYSLKVETLKGDIDFKSKGRYSSLILYSADGDISFTAEPGAAFDSIFIKAANGDVRFNLRQGAVFNPNAQLVINAAKGRVIMSNTGDYYEGMFKGVEEKSGSLELQHYGKNGIKAFINAGKRIYYDGEK